MNKLLDILINKENVVGCSPIYSITNKHCQKLQQQRETGKNLKATQVTVIADKMFLQKNLQNRNAIMHFGKVINEAAVNIEQARHCFYIHRHT